MPKVLTREDGTGHLLFCPGCKCGHMYDSRWTFNGNVDSPTFSPSMLVHHHRHGEDIVCHSFTTDGKMQFLSDSTHKLSGKTVELKDFEEDDSDES